MFYFTMSLRGCYTAYFMQIQSLLCAQRYYTKQIFTRICPPKCPPNVDISFFLFGKHVPLNVPLNVPLSRIKQNKRTTKEKRSKAT